MTAAECAAWDALCQQRAPLASAFYSRAFASAVAAVRPGVRVAVIDRGGRPVAFLPFQYAGAPGAMLGDARRIGGDLNDHFGLIAAEGFRVEPESLLRLAGLSRLEFTHLDETQTAHGLTGERPEIGLRIEFPQGFAAYWNERRAADRKLCGEISRVERRAAADLGPLRLDLESAAPERDLAHLLEMKRAQYHRTGAPDPLAPPWTRALLFRLLRGADATCRPMLSVLRAGDTWMASHFGLRHGGTLHYWFPVYNPDLRRYAPGRLLLERIIEVGSEHGLRAIDRGAGDGVAKRDFATAEQRFRRGVWQRRSPAAAVGAAAAALRWRVDSWRGRGIGSHAS